MTVKFGSARSDERGKAVGGQAGDQTGREVMIQPWYRHSKGWVVLRPKDHMVAMRIALNVQHACDNPMIGYDQYQRNTLYDAAKPFGFDCSKVTIPCETDCSALVRVCCAGEKINTNAFSTSNQASVLMATGAFERLTGAQYTDYPDLLRPGDILVTREKAHTVVVLLPDIEQGDYDTAVAWAQELLAMHGHKLDVDGDFGPDTDKVVRAFQRANRLTIDGVIGPVSWAALLAPVRPVEAPPSTTYTYTLTTPNKPLVDALKAAHGGTITSV